MILQELFDTKAKLTITTNTADEFYGKAVIGSRTIDYEAARHIQPPDDPVENHWTIAFRDKAEYDSVARTGKGLAMEVLAGAAEFIEKLIAEHDPDTIMFTASFDAQVKANISIAKYDKTTLARANVYQKMIERKLPAGYTLTTKDNIHERVFKISKK